MAIDRRRFVSAALTVGASLSLPATALAQTAGRDYTVLNPAQPTDNPGKIEVTEFFSYGCPHCSDFSPLLSLWAEKLPADVVLRKVPVSFGRAAWGNAARLFYALEVSGDLKRLDGDIFKAIHQQRTNLFDEKTIREWVAARGVNAKKFNEAFASFGVQSKVRRGDQMAQAHRIEGVPALIIDGRFQVGTLVFEQQLAVADKLIERVRAERSGKK